MPIELTEQQQRTLDGAEESPPRVVDPRTQRADVLIPEGDDEEVRELIEDDRRQRALRKVALRNAVGRMDDQP